MKTRITLSILIVLSCLLLASFTTADKKEENISGYWKADNVKLTLRKKEGKLKYSFIGKQVSIRLNIKEAKLVSGSIGEAEFENAVVSKNKGNSSVTGIAYLVKVELKEPVCEGAPLVKKLELWIKPQTSADKLVAEVRDKDQWDAFPMGECTFTH